MKDPEKTPTPSRDSLAEVIGRVVGFVADPNHQDNAIEAAWIEMLEVPTGHALKFAKFALEHYRENLMRKTGIRVNYAEVKPGETERKCGNIREIL